MKTITALRATLDRIWAMSEELGVAIPADQMEAARLTVAKWIIEEVTIGTTDMQVVFVGCLNRLSRLQFSFVKEDTTGWIAS